MVSTASNLRHIVDFGIFMGTTEGIAAGAVPDPNVSGDNPGWLYRTRILIDGTAVDVPEMTEMKEDLRGMRKFGAADCDLALVIDNSGAGVVEVTGLVRLLIKLP